MLDSHWSKEDISTGMSAIEGVVSHCYVQAGAEPKFFYRGVNLTVQTAREVCPTPYSGYMTTHCEGESQRIKREVAEGRTEGLYRLDG